MKGVQQQLRGEGDIRNEANPSSGFDAIELESVMGTQERETWLDNRQQDHDLLVDVNDASIFYGDFPPLPDFPCMSSSSSSSSTPAPVKSVASSASTASSSSSAASWAVLKSDVDEDHVERRNNGHGHGHYHQHHHLQNDLVDGTPAALSSTASMEILQPPDQVDGVDCMDVMENFGYMDLLDNNDLFDPSSIFHHDDTGLDQEFQQEQKPEEQTQQLEQEVPMVYSRIEETQADEKASDDLAMVFLEWLKTNKETVSAEDLRRVKIKKATIECAARRLGGGKEAMKQLLKLILEWVQTNHLQKRRIKESASNNNIDLPYQYQDPFQNPNPNSTFSSNPNLNCNSVPPPEPNSCFCQPPWIPQPAYVTDPSASVVPGFAPLAGYMGDPFANGAPNVNSHTYQPPTDYQMLESAQTWPPSQFVLASQYNSFPETNLHPAQPSAFPGYANQYPCQYTHGHNNDQRIVRLGSSATKEARKKRMARQRRFAPHHRNHHNHPHHNQQSQHQNQSVDQHARLVSDNCVAAAAAQANPGNWVYWPAVSGGGVAPNPPVLPGDVPVVHPVDRPAMQVQTYQRQVASDRRQVGSLIFGRPFKLGLRCIFRCLY